MAEGEDAGGERYTRIKERARQLKLHTVCEEAQCPNVGECWSGGTATFMVLGDTCTRGCRFCAVMTARNPAPPDVEEPQKLAAAIAEMELDYVVVTSVNRDDLADQGAGHFAACILASRAASPNTMVEVLIPDFRGRTDLLDSLLEARPDVLAHNVETVPGLQVPVRDRAPTGLNPPRSSATPRRAVSSPRPASRWAMASRRRRCSKPCGSSARSRSIS